MFRKKIRHFFQPRNLRAFIQTHAALLVVVGIGVWIALANLRLSEYYTGWDNIHAEFNFPRYVKQVFFGAWLEHQGLGAPAAQGHLSEIPRLPILFILKVLLPDTLVRYAYISSLFIIGGIGMYYFLLRSWLIQTENNVKKRLASLGAILYLLHILTLQQFYISFEMFMAQFAFLPFVLLTVENILHARTRQSVLWFIVVQLLIAPSGHTPTVFYLAVLLTLLYAFMLTLKKGFKKAFQTSFMLGLVTFAIHAYWIIPNLYYSLHNSSYVQESRENQLFGPESVWSIRENSTWLQFIKGTHYLFTWKDYNFVTQDFDFIFNEWERHLNNPLVSGILVLIGVITIAGFFVLLKSKQYGDKRWAMLLFYLFCVAFIWINLFPTAFIFDFLYRSPAFLEAFRNPFTKLSILYSFVSIVLFVTTIESIVLQLKRFDRETYTKGTKAILISLTLLIVVSALPSFQGQFISEKLRASYPDTYRELQAYFKTRPSEGRVLVLPQLNHAGWEYFDWQFMGDGNGYQGMGFYFFMLPQAVLHRDSDRWVETSDFFYHEVKFALDTNDGQQFAQVLNKYHIDSIIVDETKFDPTRLHNFTRDHGLATASGMVKRWQKDFLTVYERPDHTATDVIVPDSVPHITADTTRVTKDPVYAQLGEYVLADSTDSNASFPFSDLYKKELAAAEYTADTVRVTRSITPHSDVSIPGITGTYTTPVAISYKDTTVTVTFPETTVFWGEYSQVLPKPSDHTFTVPNPDATQVIIFNNIAVTVEQGKSAYPIIVIPENEPFKITYQSMATDDSGRSFATFVPVIEYNIQWHLLRDPILLTPQPADTITVETRFPRFDVPIGQNPSLNCSSPERGSVTTTPVLNGLQYTASGFGVNCNGFDVEYFPPAYDYLVNVAAETEKGRGIKLFVNYSDKEILTETYLFQDKKNDITLPLPALNKNPVSQFYLNWETRSLGGESHNTLNHIWIMPFPITQIASMAVTQPDTTIPVNQASVKEHTNIFNFLYILDSQCSGSTCYLGIDQSYDDLWLAFSLDGLKRLPHYRYNNWANLWYFTSDATIVIVYLPEVIALVSLGILPIGCIYCLKKYPTQKRGDRFTKYSHRIRKRLTT